MREQLKTLLLVALVGISLLLSLGIWYSTPQYEAVDGPQYATTVITDPTYQRTISDVVKPRSLILHFGEEKHTALFPGQFSYDNGMELLGMASFFDLKVESEFGEAQWKKVINEGPSLEVDFGTDMPVSVLESAGLLKFTSRFDPTMQTKTLYLYKGQTAEEDLRALFYSSIDRKMHTARVMLPKDRYTQLFDTLKTGGIPYQMFGQSLHKHFYLPQGRLRLPQYAVEVNPSPQLKRMMETFFVDQSLVRQVLVRDGSEILTDGIRLVERKDNILTYKNITPTSKLAGKTDADVSIGKALSFVNQHGGFALQTTLLYEPQVSISDKTNGRVYQFRSYVEGTPLIDRAGSVWVNLFDNEVVKMQTSQLLLGQKPYRGKELELISGSELLSLVQSSAFDRNKITDAYLAYLLDTPTQDDYANLHPVWVVEQQGEWGGGIFDAVTGEELHSKEVLLSGLE